MFTEGVNLGMILNVYEVVLAFIHNLNVCSLQFFFSQILIQDTSYCLHLGMGNLRNKNCEIEKKTF